MLFFSGVLASSALWSSIRPVDAIEGAERLGIAGALGVAGLAPINRATHDDSSDDDDMLDGTHAVERRRKAGPQQARPPAREREFACPLSTRPPSSSPPRAAALHRSSLFHSQTRRWGCSTLARS